MADDKMRKDPNLLNGKGEADIEWVTVNGAHIPVVDGEFMPANEFHKIANKKIDKFQHPMHVYAKNKVKAKGHTLTTTKKDYGETADAEEMRQNPNPEDNRTSYFIPRTKEILLEDLTEPLKNWKLNKSDNKKMKQYRDEPFNK